MLRRLYFVIPDKEQAARLVNDLELMGVDRRHMHALSRGDVDLSPLPSATPRQKRDAGWWLEWRLWNANLALFFVALIGFAAALYYGSTLWTVVTLAVMITTFAAGALFVLFVPDTHLDEFRGALAHREILLMVDVPKRRVAEVEEFVYRRHPEAMPGGSGWTIEGLGI